MIKCLSQVKMPLRLLILVLAFYSTAAFSVDGQGQTLKSLDDYKAEYKVKYDAIFTMIESNTELNFREKQAHYDRELVALKSEFKAQRTRDYAEVGSGSVTKTVVHTCRGRSASGAHFSMPVNCGYKCVEAPEEKMFTKEEWVTITGSIYSDVLITPSKACVEVTSLDTSLKKVTLSAIFKYNDSNIELKIVEEADALFSQE